MVLPVPVLLLLLLLLLLNALMLVLMFSVRRFQGSEPLSFRARRGFRSLSLRSLSLEGLRKLGSLAPFTGVLFPLLLLFPLQLLLILLLMLLLFMLMPLLLLPLPLLQSNSPPQSEHNPPKPLLPNPFHTPSFPFQRFDLPFAFGQFSGCVGLGCFVSVRAGGGWEV
ncbi:hypothetical protein DACRYDRAFT_22072 [Dacryopinax primogenitus]|uniref:Uncharacterized protein n=1 Tax=Dacryopinax primogenitus (strain DJM 731) TaxID=1858805 RepID=M5GDI8_DACPD|nr:uncharacterized protein DACRYDRAFT_22072 [Dacryopinax primogenitus]EJU02438.1 hypothetical protein DACRYDRAFT_22072 [Dacryopinax primogenitus]